MDGPPSSGAFTGATLAEKLNKLNASQQSIETLSHWCIFHRKKAKEIVDTWASKFHEAPKEQRVPFLYLANDILQNSRRKGPEFVNAFWTVLPAVLRDVLDSGDESVRNPAYRLVSIWEDRRVFGSRGQSLREELLGKRLQSPKQQPKQSSPNYQSFEGTLLERVARSYQAAHEKSVDEYGAVSKCNEALSMVVNLEKEAEAAGGNGDMQASVSEELLEQELVMRQCVEQLESCERSHAMLCSDLKDALHVQENKLEQIRAQLQTAQSQLQQTKNVQQRLASGITSDIDFPVGGAPTVGSVEEGSASQEHDNLASRDMDTETHISMSSGSGTTNNPTVNELSAEPTGTSQAPTSALSTAAEIAAKLAASSSSAAMLTSVLSSLAAEEAGNGLHSPNFNMDGAQKRPRLENHVDQLPAPAPVPYQLPPQLSQFLQANPMMPPGYTFQTAMPPPPMQNHMMLTQHSMGPPPPPMPPSCNPIYQFQQQPSPYYSPPPLPAPPAPAPRQ